MEQIDLGSSVPTRPKKPLVSLHYSITLANQYTDFYVSHTAPLYLTGKMANQSVPSLVAETDHQPTAAVDAGAGYPGANTSTNQGQAVTTQMPN